jgi:L-fucose isomerase-like protein
MQTINKKSLVNIVAQWEKEAAEVIEPQLTDLYETARMYSALKILLEREKANALGINCLEMMKKLKTFPPCYALTRLRDEGIHAACETDIVTLLTMMLLGYISDAPAFMGNIVAAIPATNTISISHDVTPTKMAGYEAPAKPYILRNYHWSPGVTAHVELDIGQELTLARISRELDKICLTSGSLVECRDTIACRTTISVTINDVRELVKRTYGYHLAVVYGNQTKLTSELCHKMGIQAVMV